MRDPALAGVTPVDNDGERHVPNGLMDGSGVRGAGEEARGRSATTSWRDRRTRAGALLLRSRWIHVRRDWAHWGSGIRSVSSTLSAHGAFACRVFDVCDCRGVAERAASSK